MIANQYLPLRQFEGINGGLQHIFRADYLYFMQIPVNFLTLYARIGSTANHAGFHDFGPSGLSQSMGLVLNFSIAKPGFL